MARKNYTVSLTLEHRRRLPAAGQGYDLREMVSEVPSVEILGGNGFTSLRVRADTAEIEQLRRAVAQYAKVQESKPMTFF